MIRPICKKLLMVAALTAVCFVLSSGSASAFHGHRYGHGGWYGYGYGCGYGWGYGSVYGWGSGYYPGYVYTGSCCSPCATNWGWNSCWNSGWSCWSSPNYSSWQGPYYNCWSNRGYGYYGAPSGCCSAAAVATPTIAGRQTPFARTAASALAKAPERASGYRAPRDGVLLSIDVPEDARVYVDGTLTKTAGTHRQYICSGLLPGNSYAYQVRAVVTRNGKEVSDTRVVRFRAGETRDLAFDLVGHPAAVVAARLR